MAAASLPAPHLGVAADAAALETADGKPFRWLADTDWDLLYRLDNAELEQLLAVRKAQGFNVLLFQMLPGARQWVTPQHLSAFSRDADGTLDPKRPDPAFYALVRTVVERINAAGFVAAIVPTWQSNVADGFFDADTAEAYGQTVAASLGDLSVVWLLGGDADPKDADLPIWRAMAAGIRVSEPRYNLMSFHPRSGASSDWFAADDWLDFDTIQSGHARLRPARKSISGVIETARDRQPKRPVIDMELGYEDIPDGLGGHHPDETVEVRPGDRFSAYDVRVRAWQSLLAGALGYTYGTLDVARFYEPDLRDRWPPHRRWSDAVHLPGAEEMRAYMDFRAELARGILKPRSDLLEKTGSPKSDYFRVLGACDPQGSLCAVYTPSGAPVTLSEAATARTIEAEWLDPRSGQRSAALPRDGRRFAPPEAGAEPRTDPRLGTGNDWVLILTLN